MQRIMYIERKAGSLTGEARIGKIKFSKTGGTLYYDGKAFLKVTGYKYNCIDLETGEEYWISGCKKNGADSLFITGVPVIIDEDVRQEYWTLIRNQPHLSFKNRSN